MLPRDPLIPPVLRVGAPVAVEAQGDPRQQAFQRALAPLLGKAMQGEVLARLTDGSFVVRVAGTPARMQLPPGSQAGAQLPMTLVAVHPRPTFQVGTGQAGAAAFTEAGPPLPEGADPAAAPLAYHEGATPQGLAARSLARAAALLAGAHSLLHGQAATGDGDGAELSAAGKALGTVMGAALKAGEAPRALAAHEPVLGAPTQDAAAIAPALRQALARSGLFYESHVAEWAQGQRPLAELAAEPQMGTPRPGPLSDPATAQFVSMQLAAHEQAHVAWQGQLWPGQPMEWEVDREAHHGEDGSEPAWQSRLRLRFPLLGDLTASVVLAGEHVQVRLVAGEATGELLRAHADRFADALAAAGTPLAALAIDTPGDGHE